MNWGCNQKLRDSKWDVPNSSFEKDRAYGFSWPQRNYRCSFCKKEFKSAQALGGHMNVHRRDRARLRLSPSSWDSSTTIPNPNTNPNFFSSWSPLSPVKFSHFNSLSSYSSRADHPSNSLCIGERKVEAKEYLQQHMMNKKNKGAMLDQFTGFAKIKDAGVCKANEFLRLDLNVDLIQDSKEDLDLELRLGYS